jgi:repressor LexA
MNITDSQQAILDFIAQRIEQDGGPPSQTEIANAFGFRGVRAAQYHLNILEQAGYIRRMPGQARGIRLCHPVLQLACRSVPISPAKTTCC